MLGEGIVGMEKGYYNYELRIVGACFFDRGNVDRDGGEVVGIRRVVVFGIGCLRDKNPKTMWTSLIIAGVLSTE